MKIPALLFINITIASCSAGPRQASPVVASPVVAATAPGARSGGDARKVEIAWNRFYNYDELGGLLKKIADAYPDLCSVSSIGKTQEGRDMWVMTLHNKKTGAEMQKPATWVDGNVHGNEVQGGEACLYLAWYLTENYATNLKVRETVDRSVFYILPSQNPDGRQHWFDAPNTPSSSRSGKKADRRRSRRTFRRRRPRRHGRRRRNIKNAQVCSRKR